jgi:glycosyl hydrolase family 67
MGQFGRAWLRILSLKPFRGVGYALLILTALSTSQAQVIDLSHASLLVPRDLDGPETAAVQLLVNEVAKRTGVLWRVSTWDSLKNQKVCESCILIGRSDQFRSPVLVPSTLPAGAMKPEAFLIETTRAGSAHRLMIAGKDDRGVLYGVGYLLRHIEYSRDHVILPAPLHVVSAPQFAVRGHQLGYRFKNNTYDAWTPEQFEQYIRDLAVFGTNTIEILPPITDDAPSSPLFPLPAMEMMSRISGIVQKYGLRCSVYYPAMATDYSDPQTIASELRVWGDVFSRLPQVDELFVPGGDPGHTDPAVLFPFVARVAEVLHRWHPHAGVWVSAQGFNADQMKRFYSLVAARPPWLTGIVVGPQSRDGLEVQRAHIAKQIPIRFYPDIGHSMHSQLPVPEWDVAYALTEGREVINPRPLAETTIFRHYAPYMNSFVTYSEGVNDDVNKFIWSALGWSAQTNPIATLREYARYFAGSDGFQSDDFARGIVSLERNWEGPLATNISVDTTLHAFERMQQVATPAQFRNWRFEAALYRAFTDAYERHRLLIATAQEQNALGLLATADHVGSAAAMQKAEAALNADPPALTPLRPWRNAIEDLAERLFRDIGLQLSVAKYGASAVERGATLDTVDVQLNDRVWLEQEFARIGGLSNESDRLQAIAAIIHWRDPEPGGFYDDLGVPSSEPHLMRGPEYPTDPAFFRTAVDGIADRTPDQGWRLSQISYAGVNYDHPLELRFSGLRTNAQYRIRVVYAGEDYTVPVTLIANDSYVIHGPRTRTANPETVEFTLPINETESGSLDLKWTRPQGRGGGGRGLQVAEVWLVPLPSPAGKEINH